MLINAAVVAVAFVRYGGRIPGEYGGRRGWAALGLIALAYTALTLSLRTYRTVWRFATVRDMAMLGISVVGAFSLVGVLELTALRGYRPIPLSVLGLGGAMAYLVLAHVKLAPRARHAVAHRARQSMIVFGAGLGGIALVRQLQHEKTGYRPVAFLDDDRAKVGRLIAGLPVVGTRADVARAVQRYNADAVAIAIPSAHSKQIREIAVLALDANAKALALPSIAERMSGTGPGLQDVGLEELVGRSEVTVDEHAVAATFTGRRVLITGAAGSIGSELARQIASLSPARLDLVDNNESGLADLRDELAAFGISLGIVVADITNASAIEEIFTVASPTVVIHAAALKHVDITENQPRSAAEVNVLGTWNCIRAAKQSRVERFIFISTDKAVDPVGVLGTTKRIGELMVAGMPALPTVFSAVRFGNVLGSRGSVLPKFERQIRDGGPLTVTHAEVRRYFMSIVEAVRLVLQTTAIAEAGHTYILDMGEELSIADFAKRLARLRGLRVPQDIDLEYVGLRPGERLTESLVGHSETLTPTAHPKVKAVQVGAVASHCDWSETVRTLLATSEEDDRAELRARLTELATAQSSTNPTVKPRQEVVGG